MEGHVFMSTLSQQTGHYALLPYRLRLHGDTFGGKWR